MELARKKNQESKKDPRRNPEHLPLEKKAFRNLKRTYDKLHVEFFKLLKRFEITGPQFDLIETILLSKEGTLSIQELAERMVSLQPNITRMVDGLELAGLLRRVKGENDRRIVKVKLTNAGHELIEMIRVPLLELHMAQFAHLSEDELRLFNHLLEKARHAGQVEVCGDSEEINDLMEQRYDSWVELRK
jgi:DNA-binding MarR family transcriptional regulator